MASSPVAARCRQRRTSSAGRRGLTCAATRSMRRAPSRVHTRARPRHARMAERRLARPLVAGAARRHSAAQRAMGCSCPKAALGHQRASLTRRPARRASCRHTCAGGADKKAGGHRGRWNLGSRPRARRQAGGDGRARRAPPPRRERQSSVSCGPTRTGGRPAAGRRAGRQAGSWLLLATATAHARPPRARVNSLLVFFGLKPAFTITLLVFWPEVRDLLKPTRGNKRGDTQCL
jgi:hypothetical protein